VIFPQRLQEQLEYLPQDGLLARKDIRLARVPVWRLQHPLHRALERFQPGPRINECQSKNCLICKESANGQLPVYLLFARSAVHSDGRLWECGMWTKDSWDI
jgi:hypothetical protein